MPKVAYLELMGDESRAYVFEEETGRLVQELSFEFDAGSTFSLELPEGVRETIVSVPLNKLGIRALDIPISDRGQIRDVLPFELEGMVLGDPQEMVIDAVPLTSPEEGSLPDEKQDPNQKQRVLAVYMENEKLASLLGSLKNAGIDPRAVTSSELAEMVRGLKSGNSLTDMVAGAISLDESERLELARNESTGEPTVNFRMGRFAYTREEEKTRRMLFYTLALAAALVLTLAGHMFLKASSLSKEAAAIDAKSVAIYLELFPGKKPQTTKGLRYKAEAKVKALRDKAELYREAGVLGLLMGLQDSMVQGLKLTEITVDSRAVVLRGTAEGLDDVHAFRDSIAGSHADSLNGFLKEVTISESGAAAAGGTGFTITALKGYK